MEKVEDKVVKPVVQFVIGQDILEATLQYIATKPYNESAQLIQAIQQGIKPLAEAVAEKVVKTKK